MQMQTETAAEKKCFGLRREQLDFHKKVQLLFSNMS